MGLAGVAGRGRDFLGLLSLPLRRWWYPGQGIGKDSVLVPVHSRSWACIVGPSRL